MRTVVIAALAGLAMVFNVSAQAKSEMKETTPSQVLQIRKQIELLKVHKGASPVLTIQVVGKEALVQLSRCVIDRQTSWSLNIPHDPSQEKLPKALAKVGITLPQTWKEEGPVVYDVPSQDLSQLPQFIHDLFVKLFKLQPTYMLNCDIEDVEESKVDFAPSQFKVGLGMGDDIKAADSDKAGSAVSFKGMVSNMVKAKGQILGTVISNHVAEAVISNYDDNYKKYGIVLDEKGKQLAESSGFIQVKGHVEIKDGKRMLVVEEFSKKAP